MSKVSIKSGIGKGTTLFIDDKEIQHCSKLVLEISPCNVPILKLEIMPTELEVDSEVLVVNEKGVE